MTPAQLKQALTIRTLRAEKAERVLREARDVENRAQAAVDDAQAQLAEFDEMLDMRISAFYAKASTGVRPESLHSARSFHADLASQRTTIIDLIRQAEMILEDAKQRTARARSDWAQADASKRKLEEIHTQAQKLEWKNQERQSEQDADEQSVSRTYRTTE